MIQALALVYAIRLGRAGRETVECLDDFCDGESRGASVSCEFAAAVSAADAVKNNMR
jgi:hypothetical protein